MNHVITKIVFNVTADKSFDGIALQQDLSNLFWQKIAEAIDKVFDNLNLKDKTLIINTLELDLGEIGITNWQQALTDKLVEALHIALKNQVARSLTSTPKEGQEADVTTTVLYRERLFEVWLYFLKTGALPPSVSAALDEAFWHKAIAETLTLIESAEQQFLELIKTSPSVLEPNQGIGIPLNRLVLQFDESFLATITSILTRSNVEQLPALRLRFFNYLDKVISLQTEPILKKYLKILQLNYSKQAFWAILFQQIANGSLYKTEAEAAVSIPLKLFFEKQGSFKNAPQAHIFIEAINPYSIVGTKLPTPSVSEGFSPLSKPNWVKLQADILKIIETRFAQPSIKLKKTGLDNKAPISIQNKDKESNKKDSDSSVQYIQNAGVVLTHAFLPMFFKELKLINDKKQFRNEPARHRAIYLIHYLASGQEGLPEFRLLLPKLLCGWRLDLPIERTIVLKKKEKKEADALLKAVIKHWGALGNASIEALREGFFNRDGKLSTTDKGQLLQIEQRTEDILLSRLPWSIGMIKLLWMKEMLFVEWT